MYPQIEPLVKQYGFTLQLWDDRYGKGVWAVCLPLPQHAAAIQSASEDGDLNMLSATEHIHSTEWLPVEIERDVTAALRALDASLTGIARDCSDLADWRRAVHQAIDDFVEVQRANPGYGNTTGQFAVLPATLAELEQRIAYKKSGAKAE
jgi:hypothetical protein